MTTSDIAALDQYRGRRMQRLREGLAMYSVDPKRREVSRCLAAIASATGADRLAVAHVDEFGDGSMHTYCMLDLLGERPRRNFDVSGFLAGWDGRIPGFVDDADGRRSRSARRQGNSLICALGSDGARAWFIVAESVTPRSPLETCARDDVLFYSGRCAAAVIHNDLERPGDSWELATWPLLQDLTGREENDSTSRRIASRFVIVRALRTLLDQGGPSLMRESLADACKAELTALPPDDPERRIWEGVADAIEGEDWNAMAEAAIALASEAERLAHFAGAEEAYLLAYDLASFVARTDLATDATRFRARVLRRQGRWSEAEELYVRAQDLARATFDHERLGLILSGRASVSRAKGNLRRTRELLMAQLEIGTKVGSNEVLGAAYHDLMAVDKEVGDLESALINGWSAVRYHEDLQRMLEALADLAGVLTAFGMLSAAEDAYSIVVARIEHKVYRIYALDGLARVAAVRQDRNEFERRLAVVLAEGLPSLPEAVQAELLYCRAVSYETLGDLERAAYWYGAARDRSEAWGVNKVMFDAEAGLAALQLGSEESRRARAAVEGDAAHPEVDSIRSQIKSLRAELVGT